MDASILTTNRQIQFLPETWLWRCPWRNRYVPEHPQQRNFDLPRLAELHGLYKYNPPPLSVNTGLESEIDWTTFNTILQYTTIYYNFLQVFLQQYEIIFIYFMDLEWNRITGSGQFSGSPGKLPCFTPAKPLQSNPTIFNPHDSNSVLEEKRIWNLCLKILFQEPNVPSSILILCMEVFHKKYQTSHKNPHRNRPPQSLVAMIVKRQRRDADLQVHHAVTIVIGVSFKNWCFFHNRHLTKPMTWRHVNVYNYGV